MIYKTQSRKQKIEQDDPHLILGLNSCAPEGLAVPALLLASGMLLVKNTNIM